MLPGADFFDCGTAESRRTNRSLGQSRDDVPQRRQRFVDVLRLVQHGALGSRLADLFETADQQLLHQLFFFLLLIHKTQQRALSTAN